MDKKTLGIIGVIVAAFVALIGVSMAGRGGSGVDYKTLDRTKIIPASEASGNYPEMIEGNEDAKVILVEYGDYQCTACAPMNPYINELIEDYKGQVALVYRTMIMDYHQNGTAAASAALAASKQGYWKEMKDILYTNQDDWYYSASDKRTEQFEEYFKTVSKGEGDLEQFRADVASKETSKKIAFDAKLSELEDVQWTPYFMIDGELYSQKDISRDEFLKNLRSAIDRKLADK